MKQILYQSILAIFMLVAFAADGMAQSYKTTVYVDLLKTQTVESGWANTLNRPGVTVTGYNWRTSNSNIKIVSKDRDKVVIQGVTGGNAKLYYSCSYTVNGYPDYVYFYWDVSVIVKGLQLEKYSLTLYEGGNETFNATQSGATGGLYCTSDNENVAKVKAGKTDMWVTPITVTAVAPGTTTIHVKTLAGLDCPCQVTVMPKPVSATDITLPESENMLIGQELQLTATIQPDNATTKLTWKSDNTQVATVSASGLVNALAEGTANITVTTDNNLSASCRIIVQPDNNPKGYAVYNEGVLTFYYDNQIASRTGNPYFLNDYGQPGWYEHRADIEKVVFDPSFADARPTTTASWFYGASQLTAIEGIQYLNTSEVKSMRGMFMSCGKLTDLDLANFNTAKVTDMSSMFYDCQSITKLDLSSFVTSNVTQMSYMFGDCRALASLDLTSFDTHRVNYMIGMFQRCEALTQLDLSYFDTSAVGSFKDMFQGCNNLVTIYVGEKWNEGLMVANQENLFGECGKLTGGQGTAYDQTHIDFSYAHVDGADDAPGYFTFKSAYEMESTPTAYVVFNTEGVKLYYDEKMWSRGGLKYKIDEDFKGLPHELWTEDCVISFINEYGWTRDQRLAGFYYETNSVELDPSFAECKLESAANLFEGWFVVNMQYLNTSEVTDMSGMFKNSPMTDIDLSNFNTSKVKTMSGMFKGCKALKSLDLSGFNTANVMDMSGMFSGCEQISTIYVSDGWDTSSVSESDDMFLGCENLVGNRGTTYDPAHTDAAYAEVDSHDDNQPSYLTFKDVPDGIEMVTETDKVVEEYYTLDGIRLKGKPTQRGLYIMGGKKVLVK